MKRARRNDKRDNTHTPRRFSVSTRIMSTLVMLALLVPIGAPIPAYAYSNPETNPYGLKLTPDQPSVLQHLSTGLTRTASLASTFFLAVVGDEGDTKNKKPKTESVKEKAERVDGIKTRISEGLTFEEGTTFDLEALPVDKNDKRVDGVKIEWKSSNPGIVKVEENILAVAVKGGNAKLTVSAGKVTEEFDVTVLPRKTESQSLNSKQKPPVNSRLPKNFVANPQEEEDFVDGLVSAQGNPGNAPGQEEAAPLTNSAAISSFSKVGSSNYSFSLPMASLPGRQLDAGVAATYNSRMFEKFRLLGADTYEFNQSQHWLAPGFSVGYGYIDKHLGRYSLVSSSGSKTELRSRETISGTVYYEATDGSFTEASTLSNNGLEDGPTMLVKYSNGTEVLYGAKKTLPQWIFGHYGRRYPTKITDRNGNFITITYLPNDTLGRISTIRDTLGRLITFNYDSSQKLVAVTVPGFNGGADRQTIRFYYKTQTMDAGPRFGPVGNVVVWAPTSFTALEYVYFPGTDMGYKYTYSPYFGSINKIEAMRGLVPSSPNDLANTGTISGGTVSATTEYNYPATAAELNDPYLEVPTFTTRTDDWLGRDTSQAAPETTFTQIEQLNGSGVGTRTSTIVNPDGRVSESTSKVNPGVWDDGLTEETRIFTIDNGIESKWTTSKYFWEQGVILPNGGRANPRMKKTELTSEANETKATTYEYDSYNNPTIVKEHDFAAPGVEGTVLRRAEVTYETGTNWINEHMFRLQKEILIIYDGTNASKTKIEYDGSALTARNDIDSTTHTTVSNYRGNVTKVTSYADATLSVDPKADIDTRKYDVAGNLVEASMNCCNLRTWAYSVNSGYAYPITETSGTSPQISATSNYDYNTGILTSNVDPNGHQIAYSFDADNLRMNRVDLSNGAFTEWEFERSVYPYFIKETTSLDSSRTTEKYEFLDGRGEIFRTRSESEAGFISTDVEFDGIGRVLKQFSPYSVSGLNDARPAGIGFSTITERDGLNRTTELTLADGNTIQNVYDGIATTVIDQAGKKRRYISDSLGRLIRTDEPDSSGSLGSVSSPLNPTDFEYDGNNNLIKSTQSDGSINQVRRLKYDSLSRLTHELHVEIDATLADDGSAGNQWTRVNEYNSDGQLVSSTDANLVKTSFTFDGLNRRTTTVVTGESGFQTPPITYVYDQARNDDQGNPYSNLGKLTRIETGAVSNTNQVSPQSAHEFNYNDVGQVVDHSQMIGNQTYTLANEFDLAGNLVKQTYPSGKTVEIAVDDFGSIDSVKEDGIDTVSAISIGTNGILNEVTFGNGVSETFGFNNRLQLQSQTLKSGNDVLQRFEYFFGEIDASTGVVDSTKNNGKIGKIENYIGTQKQFSKRFKYDHLSRLSEASEYHLGDNTQLSYKQVFEYDDFGNLYRQNASNPTSGQQSPLPFVSIETADIDKTTNRYKASTGVAYDANGQVVSDNKFSSNRVFTYDANGRRVGTSTVNNTSATTYDGIGRRIADFDDGNWTYYIYDTFGKLIAEYGQSRISSGGKKYVQLDAKGSVRTVTNSSAHVVARYDFEVHGATIEAGVGIRSVEDRFGTRSQTSHDFALMHKDRSSNQKHSMYRKMQPGTGRWTSPDPFNGSIDNGNPQTLNRFAYTVNDPVNYTDSVGLAGERNIPSVHPLQGLFLLYMDLFSQMRESPQVEVDSFAKIRDDLRNCITKTKDRFIDNKPDTPNAAQVKAFFVDQDYAKENFDVAVKRAKRDLWRNVWNIVGTAVFTGLVTMGTVLWANKNKKNARTAGISAAIGLVAGVVAGATKAYLNQDVDVSDIEEDYYRAVRQIWGKHPVVRNYANWESNFRAALNRCGASAAQRINDYNNFQRLTKRPGRISMAIPVF